MKSLSPGVPSACWTSAADGFLSFCRLHTQTRQALVAARHTMEEIKKSSQLLIMSLISSIYGGRETGLSACRGNGPALTPFLWSADNLHSTINTLSSLNHNLFAATGNSKTSKTSHYKVSMKTALWGSLCLDYRRVILFHTRQRAIQYIFSYLANRRNVTVFEAASCTGRRHT